MRVQIVNLVYSRSMRYLLGIVLLVATGLVVTDLPAQDAAQQWVELGSCPLASGETIQGCRVGYRTFGKLDTAKDNVVIMPSWLNGRSEDLVSLFGDKPSEKRLVDTSKFFGIAFDAFGDGVSSSPSNSKSQPGPAFPVFTMEDMARAQYRVLTEKMGITHLHAAIGLSMGAHQVFAWAALYPAFLDQAIPIVGSPQATSFDLLSKQIVIDAINSDPAYNGGHYATEPPLKLANAIGVQMVSAPQYRNSQWPRDKFPLWLADVEKPQRQDANDRVWQAKAILLHDVLHGKTIAEAAKGSSAVKFLVIVAAEDRMVTPQPALEWARALGAETYVSPGTCAHLIMDCDAEAVAGRVTRFLEIAARPAK